MHAYLIFLHHLLLDTTHCTVDRHPPEAPVMSMALRFLALIIVMVSLPAVGR